ncbi:MAG: DoxX family protein [Porticoccaceae bacterium]|nr:DoxX family protein [Porticoccaceae bacterium]
MASVITLYQALHQGIFDRLKYLDGIPPLLFRLILAPVMVAAGLHKFLNFEDMVSWFGNPDWGLGLPAPAVMVFLAAASELVGGLALLIGFAVRWMAVPLMVSMAVAAGAVHWQHGWFAIAPGDPDTSAAKVVAMAGIPAAQASLENSVEVGKRVSAVKSLLKQHGNYSWLTEKGSFVVLNNGIEFAATYFVMLLSLFFTGGGRFFSLDYWLSRWAGGNVVGG